MGWMTQMDTYIYISYIYIIVCFQEASGEGLQVAHRTGKPFESIQYIYIYVGLTRKIVPSSKFHGFFL